MKNILALTFVLAVIVPSMALPTTNNNSISISSFEDFTEDIDPLSLDITCKPLCDIADTTKIIYYLYTRSNPTIDEKQLIEPMNSESIKNSNFNRRHPTRIVIHGWHNKFDSPINNQIRDAYLQKGNYNIIIVDWNSCSKSLNYFVSRCCVEDVGKQVAEMIDFLNKKHWLSFKTLKLIGHSLGAHCIGMAGKYVKNGRINTLIGLDPAKPCFATGKPEERLADTDAEYVETIHTNGDALGFYTPLGTASFYPNGGKIQAGCILNVCSHARAFEFYVESISNNNNFLPKKCESFEDLRKKNCNTPADHIRMGGDPSNHGKAKGIYYLPTNSEKPFGVGEH